MMPDKDDDGVPVKIKLTKQQKEAAKFCGLTESEYAQQLIRMIDDKMNGRGWEYYG